MSQASLANFIGLTNPEPDKAQLYCVSEPSWTVKLQFNPPSLTLTRDPDGGGGFGDFDSDEVGDLETTNDTAQKSEKTAKAGKNAKAKKSREAGAIGSLYTGIRSSSGQNDRLSFDTYFDETEDRKSKGDWLPLDPPFADKLLFSNKSNVLEPVAKLYRLTLPIDSNARGKTEPLLPAVAFLWGGFQFYGVLTNLKIDFEVFDTKGDPRRAKVSVDMKGFAFRKPKKVADIYDMDFKRQTAMAAMLPMGSVDPRVAKIKSLK